MPSLVTLVTFSMSRKMAGNSLVCISFSPSFSALCSTGNYNISKLHYDGPGETPGAGYGYGVRIERSTAAPVAVQA